MLLLRRRTLVFVAFHGIVKLYQQIDVITSFLVKIILHGLAAVIIVDRCGSRHGGDLAASCQRLLSVKILRHLQKVAGALRPETTIKRLLASEGGPLPRVHIGGSDKIQKKVIESDADTSSRRYE